MLAKGFSIIMVLVIVAMLALAGCSKPSDTPVATEKVTSLAIKKGGTFQVRLESNPTTGYRWEVTETDAKIVQQQGDAEFTPQSNLLGASGVETFTFRAVGSGQVNLKLVYRRPWEQGVAPIKSYSVNVTVK